MRRTLLAALGALLVMAVLVSRTWDLGGRFFHNDEAAHAWFAAELVDGRGYHADPAFHGPLLYHLEAAWFLAAGTGEWQARATSAAAGCLAVFLLWVLVRRHVGRREAVLATVLAAVSPSLVFYSRFNNHDLLMLVITLAVLLAVLELGRAPRAWPIVAAAAAAACGVATKLNVYFVLATLALYAMACTLSRPAWRRSARQAFVELPGRAFAMAGLVASLGLVLMFATTYLHYAAQAGATPAAAAWRTWLAIWVDGFRHWNQMHGAQRLGGPFYFYAALMMVYEPLLLAGAALAVAVFSLRRRSLLAALAVAALAGLSAAFALRWQTVWLERVLHLRPAYLIVLLPGATAAAWTVVSLWRVGKDGLALLFFFATAQSLLYGYAGEKVPWLVVHVAAPWMIVAPAAAIACWDRARQRRARLGLATTAIVLLLPSVTGSWALLTFNRSNVVEPMLQVEYGGDVGRLVEVLREAARRERERPLAVIERDLAAPFTWYLREVDIEYPEHGDESVTAPLVVVQEDVEAMRERYVGRRLRYHVWSRWLGALRRSGPRALVSFWWNRARLGTPGSRQFYVWIRRDVEARRPPR